ncbi:MAG: hypothetical protein ACC707_18480, partial [Thiohalomonadales bacterium]
VFLLMRFVNNPGISDKVLALDYINSLHSRGTLQHDQMRDVGDTCLLYAGLFPGRAARKRVPSNYFTHLGRGAYQVLSDNPEHMQQHVYQRLSAAFTPIARILQSIDKLKSRKPVELEQASSKLITSIDTFTSH